MKQIAQFEKVSFETFVNEFAPLWINAKKAESDPNEPFAYDKAELINAAGVIYEQIKLPQRATAGSAGYDFFFPFGYTELAPGSTALIPTGIKVKMEEGWALKLYPRSGLGFKYRIQLDNTVGIIDADYYNNEKNEGMICVKITNDSRQNQTVVIDHGQGYCQGVFEEFGITYDDQPVSEVREGGFGSTDQQQMQQASMPITEAGVMNKNGTVIDPEALKNMTPPTEECEIVAGEDSRLTPDEVNDMMQQLSMEDCDAEHPTDDGCSEVATVDVTQAYPDGVDCADPEH